MFLDEQTTYKVRKSTRIVRPEEEYLSGGVYAVIDDFEPYEATDIVIEGKSRTLGIYQNWTCEGNTTHMLDLWGDTGCIDSFYSPTGMTTKTKEDFLSMLDFFDNIESSKKEKAKDLSDGYYISYNPNKIDFNDIYFCSAHLYPCHVKDGVIFDIDGEIDKDDERLAEISFIKIPSFIKVESL